MKQNSRTIMPFPSLIIGLIAKERLKILSGLKVVQRDYPLVHIHSLGAQLTSRVLKQVCIRYHRIVLRRKEEIQRRRLIDSLLPQDFSTTILFSTYTRTRQT